MATLLSGLLAGGFSMFLAAVLSTVLILLLFERKFISKHAWMKWTVGSLSIFLALYLVISRPSVVPLSLVVLLIVLLPFAFVNLLMHFLKGKELFSNSVSTLLSVFLVVLAVLSIGYAAGDKIISVSEKETVLGIGDSTFMPFGMPVLGMALLLTFGSLLVYSVFSFSSKS